MGTSAAVVVVVGAAVPCELNSRLPHSLSFVSLDSKDESSRSTLSLSRRTARSRRTMPFVIFGLYPRGSMQCLHMGQRELFWVRNSSMQAGWNMWPQGSSRMMEERCSKLHRQMWQFG